jgi:hypothetical protein
VRNIISESVTEERLDHANLANEIGIRLAKLLDGNPQFFVLARADYVGFIA